MEKWIANYLIALTTIYQPNNLPNLVKKGRGFFGSLKKFPIRFKSAGIRCVMCDLT